MRSPNLQDQIAALRKEIVDSFLRGDLEAWQQACLLIEKLRPYWGRDESRRVSYARALRPRDERGWRIPEQGTDCRVIYDAMVEGMRRHDIAQKYGWSSGSVGSLMAGIKRARKRGPY